MFVQEKECISFINELIEVYKVKKNIPDIEDRISLLKDFVNKKLIKNKSSNSIPISSKIPSIINMVKEKGYYKDNLQYIELIEKCSILSPWEVGYDCNDDYFNNNFGFAELIGPNGVYCSDKISCGFVLMGKNLNYPDHLHPAVELYEVVSGPLDWSIGKNKEFEAIPGQFIYHNKNESHSMETKDFPFLGIYTWIGDIKSSSSFS